MFSLNMRDIIYVTRWREEYLSKKLVDVQFHDNNLNNTTFTLTKIVAYLSWIHDYSQNVPESDYTYILKIVVDLGQKSMRTKIYYWGVILMWNNLSNFCGVNGSSYDRNNDYNFYTIIFSEINSLHPWNVN